MSAKNKQKIVQNNQNQLNTKQHVSVERTEFFSGPTPSPELLVKYNAAVPGFGDKLCQEFLIQGAHRRDLETKVVNSNCESTKRGQWLSFILYLSAIIGGVITTLLTNNPWSLSLSCGALISIVINFYHQKSKSDEELHNKSLLQK